MIFDTGDFNYRDINWTTWTTPNSENSDDSKFIEAVRDAFLHQHVENTTRRRGNDDPSLLDLVLTNEDMQVSGITHLAPLGKSDHSILSFDFNCYVDYSKPKESPDYNKGDYVSMRNKVTNSQWLRDYSKITADTTVEEKWDSLKNMLHDLEKEFVPIRSISGKLKWMDKERVPLSKEIRDSIRQKNKAHREWMAGTNTEEERLRYVRTRNRS